LPAKQGKGKSKRRQVSPSANEKPATDSEQEDSHASPGGQAEDASSSEADDKRPSRPKRPAPSSSSRPAKKSKNNRPALPAPGSAVASSGQPNNALLSRNVSIQELQERAVALLEGEFTTFLAKRTSLAGLPPLARRPEFTLVVTDLPDQLPAFGRSSTLGWHSGRPNAAGQPLHRVKVGVYGTQRNIGQDDYFPNYCVIRKLSKQALSHYGPAGWQRFDSLMLTVPWDEMWQLRATRLYFFNPALFSTPASVAWLHAVLRFQFEYRQAIWDHLHWLHIGSRELPGGWGVRQDRRQRLSELRLLVWNSLLHACPAPLVSMTSAAMWYEPALWYLPAKSSDWVPVFEEGVELVDPPGGSALSTQLKTLDREEPLRKQWSGRAHRFVEVVGGDLQSLVQAHHRAGVSWLLPAPWDSASYVPFTQDTRVIGSPGADFYYDDDVYAKWKSETRRVKTWLGKGKLAPDTLYRLLSSTNSFYSTPAPSSNSQI
jgi:hypothetical protein